MDDGSDYVSSDSYLCFNLNLPSAVVGAECYPVRSGGKDVSTFTTISNSLKVNSEDATILCMYVCM